MTKQELKNKEIQIKKLIDETYKIDAEKSDQWVIYDGIANILYYVKAKYKILWVLKEPNDKGETRGWSICDKINNAKFEGKLDPDLSKTFPNIIYTTYGILNDLTWDEIDDFRDFPDIIDILKNIAFINIRKLPGANTSNYKEIENAYQKYKKVILQQITDYEPDIIICGNTFMHLREDLTCKYKLEGPQGVGDQTDYYYNDKLIVIDAFHPAQRNSVENENYVNSIFSAVKIWENLKITDK